MGTKLSALRPVCAKIISQSGRETGWVFVGLFGRLFIWMGECKCLLFDCVFVWMDGWVFVACLNGQGFVVCLNGQVFVVRLDR